MKATAFRPSTHGYRFRNSWTQLPSLPNLPSPYPSSMGQLSQAYGLCGGMSLGSRDEFLAGRAIPTMTTVPASNTPLYNFIWTKQIESFGFGMRYIGDFVVGMAQPDGTLLGVQKESMDAMPAIRREIDRGRPALIGQIKVSATSTVKVWDNHQVLVWGYETSGTSITLLIYDPNFPMNDKVELRCARVKVGTVPVIRRGPGGIPVPGATNVYGYQITQVVAPLVTPQGTLQGRTFGVRGIFGMNV